MENILENQNAFFSHYFGQDCFYPYGNDVKQCVDTNTIENHIISVSYLHLKPLSRIEIEDAIEVAKILDFHDGVGCVVYHQPRRVSIYDKYNDEPHRINVLYIFHHLEIFSLDEEGNVFQYDWERLIRVSDFLRSKGYYLGDGTEVEYGWVRLKTE